MAEVMELFYTFSLLFASLMYMSFALWRSSVPSRPIPVQTAMSVEEYFHRKPRLDDPSTFHLQTEQSGELGTGFRRRKVLVFNPIPHTGGLPFHRLIKHNILVQNLDVKIFDEDELREESTPEQRRENLRLFISSLSVNDSAYIHTEFEVSGGPFRLGNGDPIEALSITFIRNPVVKLLSSYYALGSGTDIFRSWETYTLLGFQKRITLLEKGFERCVRSGGKCLTDDLVAAASSARYLCRERCSGERRLAPKTLLALAKRRVHAKSSDDFLAIPIEEDPFSIASLLRRLSPEVCENLGHFMTSARARVPKWWTMSTGILSTLSERLEAPSKSANKYLSVEFSFDNWLRRRYFEVERELTPR